MRSWMYFGVVMVGCLVSACTERPSDAATATDTAKPAAASAVVVDSALPMDVLLERFRHDVPKVETLHSDAKSRGEVIRRIVGALAANDTATIQRLAVSLSEYAWLYFPTTKVAKAPYEVPPAFAWFQVQEKNRRGSARALRELGGHRLALKSYRCDPEPTVEEQNRIWSGCAITISRDGAAPVELKLFGAILERAGRFEVLSYQNDF